MNSLLWLGLTAACYFGGCVVVTILIDRWDSFYRPLHETDAMPWHGVVAGVAVVLVSFTWIGCLFYFFIKFLAGVLS